jgi:hypothetical protein
MLNPSTYAHAPRSANGAVIFVKLRQYSGADREQRVSLPLQNGVPSREGWRLCTQYTLEQQASPTSRAEACHAAGSATAAQEKPAGATTAAQRMLPREFLLYSSSDYPETMSLLEVPPLTKLQHLGAQDGGAMGNPTASATGLSGYEVFIVAGAVTIHSESHGAPMEMSTHSWLRLPPGPRGQIRISNTSYQPAYLYVKQNHL